jgi:transaldolase
MNSIQLLNQLGQSIWLDYISRHLLESGELKFLINEGISGLTSNPSIFQKSICETHDYDAAIKNNLALQPNINMRDLYEKLAIEDIQVTADYLRPIYDSTQGTDGFVSLEVSPHLSDQTQNTIAEARRLWNVVNRPNLMIKVPATPEGIPAVEALIAQGINVNATLIFSLSQYEQVAMAYIKGLEKNTSPGKVSSVASFFISRIDTAIDKALEKVATPEALALQGKAAISSAKVVYKQFNNIFYGDNFKISRSRGGKVQKLVWGSTGTKNPRYSDVIYVEELIGPDTLNTIPMATLKSFLSYGQPCLTLQEDIKSAESNLLNLKQFNIDLDKVTDQLLMEGVSAFVQADNQVINSLTGQCKLFRS